MNYIMHNNINNVEEEVLTELILETKLVLSQSISKESSPTRSLSTSSAQYALRKFSISSTVKSPSRSLSLSNKFFPKSPEAFEQSISNHFVKSPISSPNLISDNADSNLKRLNSIVKSTIEQANSSVKSLNSIRLSNTSTVNSSINSNRFSSKTATNSESYQHIKLDFEPSSFSIDIPFDSSETEIKVLEVDQPREVSLSIVHTDTMSTQYTKPESLNELNSESERTESSFAMPYSWSNSEVVTWLVSKGHDTAVNKFIEHKINGSELLNLNLSKLREIGLELGDRTNLLNSIYTLKIEQKLTGSLSRINNFQYQIPHDDVEKNTESITSAKAILVKNIDSISKPTVELTNTEFETNSETKKVTIKVPYNDEFSSEEKDAFQAFVVSKDSGFAEFDQFSFKSDDEDILNISDDKLKRTMSYFTISDYYEREDGRNSNSPETDDIKLDENIETNSPIKQAMTIKRESFSKDVEILNSYSSELPQKRSSGPANLRPSPLDITSAKKVGNTTSLPRSAPAEINRVFSSLSANYPEYKTLEYNSSIMKSESADYNQTTLYRHQTVKTSQPINVATDFDGWLFVRVDSNRSWKKRWCILKNGTMI
ncbi:hypothetical protein HK096_002650 [Nowakowskiella sp. JEL0078]|nr:hypothetical protein HK096_002650 [Nowakowskiella sp. JEL0078]